MDTFALRETFSKMRDLVRTGKWRRDYTNRGGKFCMIGMIIQFPSVQQKDLYRLLDGSIEEKELGALEANFAVLPTDIDGFKTFNGGKIRGFSSASQRIASYNNTRDGEADILAWLDRAEQLAYEPNPSETTTS